MRASDEPLYALEHDVRRDLIITGVSLGAWGASEVFFKSTLSSPRCGWCETDLTKLNAVDRWGRRARWADDDLGGARALSNLVAFGALPLATVGADLVLGKDLGRRELGVDLLIVAQSVGISGVINQATKFSVRRERPFVAALSPEHKPGTEEPLDNNVSFYSGHTSFAFALAVSTGTVATLRNYPNRWLIWAVGLPLAASVGYFRIAADKHYLTDVLVGAAAGSAIGAAVPLLLHPRTGEVGGVTLSMSTHLRGFTLNGAF